MGLAGLCNSVHLAVFMQGEPDLITIIGYIDSRTGLLGRPQSL